MHPKIAEISHFQGELFYEISHFSNGKILETSHFYKMAEILLFEYNVKYILT